MVLVPTKFGFIGFFQIYIYTQIQKKWRIRNEAKTKQKYKINIYFIITKFYQTMQTSTQWFCSYLAELKTETK